jgi:hypothetical protein
MKDIQAKAKNSETTLQARRECEELRGPLDAEMAAREAAETRAEEAERRLRG